MFSTTTQVLVTQLGTAFPNLSGSLDPHDIQLLGRKGERRLLMPGQDLVAPGQRLPGLVLVLRGRLRPRAAPGEAPEHRWVVGAGEAIGVEAVIGRRARHDSLVALEPSEVRLLDPATWTWLTLQSPRVAVGLLEVLARDLAAEVAALSETLAEGAR